MSPIDTYALRLDQTFAAPPEQVFDGFLAMYGEDRPPWIVRSDLDLRPGGRWDVTFHPPGGDEFREERVITVVERPERLAYEASIRAADRSAFTTSVTLSVTANGPSTRLTLTQKGFPTAAQRDEFATGWSGVLDGLDPHQ